MQSNFHNSSASDKSSNKLWSAVLFVTLISVTIFIRIRMLPTPLERDEGEYAYAGQLMLQGVPPYSLAYNMKMPGIYAAYAVILAMFGQTQSAIHFAVLLLNTATILMIFIIARRLFGNVAGVAAGAFFAITSISNRMQATANAENFVIFFAMAGIIFLLNFKRSLNTINLIAAALLLGIAFLMKQHAAAFILFGFFYVMYVLSKNKPIRWKNFIFAIFVYSIFVLLPFLITCLILWYYGVFEKFWFWTFEYARHYVGLTPLSEGIENLKKTLLLIIPGASLIWLFAFLGLLSVIWNRRTRIVGVFLIGFLGFSFLAVCPGLYFRPHYYILFMPALCVSAAAGVIAVTDWAARFIKSPRKLNAFALILIAALWSHSFYKDRFYLLESDPQLLSRYNFGFLPFPESLKIAQYVKENSEKDDKIVVFGSEPQIYFYSQRRSATPYIYTYPLMENQPFALQMQKDMISHIEENMPKFFILVKTPDSWMPLPDSEKYIFKWADKFIPENYRYIGLVEIFGEQGPTLYRWDSFAKPSKSEGWIMIFQRKE